MIIDDAWAPSTPALASASTAFAVASRLAVPGTVVEAMYPPGVTWPASQLAAAWRRGCLGEAG